MKVLFDTCIIIDILQKRTPFFDDAYSLLMLVANNVIEGAITAKAVTDIYYLMHRYHHNDTEARKTLNILFNLFSVIDTTEYDVKQALTSEISDYEDAVMVESALNSGVNYIVTRNLKDYTKSKVSVLSPSKMLQKAKN